MKVQESERPQFSIQRTKLMLGQVFRRSVVGGLSMLFMPFAHSEVPRSRNNGNELRMRKQDAEDLPLISHFEFANLTTVAFAS